MSSSVPLVGESINSEKKRSHRSVFSKAGHQEAHKDAGEADADGDEKPTRPG